mgnify:CR=1 FL=1
MTRTFPPGPKAHLPLGLEFANKFKTDPLGTAKEMRTFGDISHIRLGPWEWYHLNSPELIKDAFVTESTIFGKTDRFKKILGKTDRFKKILGTVDGNGLVLSEGEFWLRQRRIIQPSFRHEKLADYATIMIAKADAIVDKWSDGSKLDLSDEMTSLTLSIISKILFGIDVGDEAKRLGDAVTTISNCLYREFSDIILFPEWIPLPSKIEKHQAVAVLDELISKAISQSEAHPDAATMIASILAAVDSEGDGTGMTKLQARDEAITMFNAGHDSTASALSWSWYLLARHNAIYDAFLAEVDALTLTLNGAAPTLHDLAKVPLAAQIVKETLRLYPPAWTLPRQAKEEAELGGYVIPEGGLVNIFPYVIQRDAK